MSRLEIEINNNQLFDDQTFKVNIIKCSEEHCHPQKAQEKRVRNYYSLHFITHGKGVLRTDDNEYKLEQGSAFLLFANEPYVYYPSSSDPWSYIWVDFYGEKLNDMFYACGLSKHRPFVKVQKFKEYTEDLKRLVESYDGSEVQQLMCSGYFMIVLSRLIDNANEMSFSYKGHSSKFKYVREALIYINNNYRLDLSIDTISKNARISSSYLMGLFSDEIGITPTQYINMFRVASACELLKMPDVRVNEVANMVGYADPLYFSRVFTKIKGISPKQYALSKHEDKDPFYFLQEKNIDFR